jgi:nucleotide-binding universal stress UspA family protein
MSRFQTIVAAVDFSDTATEALEAAVSLASFDPQARVHLLHVVPDPMPAVWSDELPQIDMHMIEHTWRDGATRQLGTLAGAAKLDPARFETAVAVGTPATEIVRYAERQGADVIVMGSHGHGVVARFLLGSVAERVVRQAPCPVLVVPHRTLRGAAKTETTEPATEAVAPAAKAAGAR